MKHAEQATKEQLEALGFDRSEEDGNYMRVRCGQCEALVINGTPTHETGCPNQMHECEECETLIPKRQRLCESCANPDDIGWVDDEKDQRRSDEASLDPDPTLKRNL